MTGSTAIPAKQKPWQFSLRFLLAVMTLVCVAAAFFGWRERRLEPQRRAVAKIIELGGSVETERVGWCEALWRGCDTNAVVRAELPDERFEDIVPALGRVTTLRNLTLDYGVFEIVNNSGITIEKRYVIGGKLRPAGSEIDRLKYVRDRLPTVNVDMKERPFNFCGTGRH